jgi:hypothetical protein
LAGRAGSSRSTTTNRTHSSISISKSSSSNIGMGMDTQASLLSRNTRRMGTRYRRRWSTRTRTRRLAGTGRTVALERPGRKDRGMGMATGTALE